MGFEQHFHLHNPFPDVRLSPDPRDAKWTQDWRQREHTLMIGEYRIAALCPRVFLVGSNSRVEGRAPRANEVPDYWAVIQHSVSGAADTEIATADDPLQLTQTLFTAATSWLFFQMIANEDAFMGERASRARLFSQELRKAMIALQIKIANQL